jgi:hypothetical protein
VANCLQPEKIGENPAGKPKLVGFHPSIFLSSPRGIVLIDGETYRVRDAKPAPLALLNCTRKQLMQRPLQKPFRMAALLAKIRSVLDNKPSIRRVTRRMKCCRSHVS